MAWKILTIIAIIVIGAACGLWWKNHDFTDRQMKDLDKQINTLATRNKEIETEKARIVELKQSIVNLEDEKNQFDATEVDAKNQLVQKEAEYSELVSEEQEKIEKRDRFQTVADTGPEIEQLRREIANVQTEISSTESDIASKEGIEEATSNDNVRLRQIADDLVQLRFNQQNAVITSDFASRVIEAQNRWGFVVVEGGDKSGVVHNAPLNVYRGERFLCKLIVTEVQPTKTVAEIVPGTLGVNTHVQVGDIVVKAETPTVLPVAPQGAVVAPNPVGGIGGGLAPEPAPASVSDDPFGSPAPAAPASDDPDPFGSSDDPFGSSDDPFGGN